MGALSIIGIPPTCGFFSKWYLISGGIAAGHWGFVAALLFSSVVMAIVFFRLFEIGYFKSGHDQEVVPLGSNEAPKSMVFPLLIVAVSLIGIGLYTNELVRTVIRFALPEGL